MPKASLLDGKTDMSRKTLIVFLVISFVFAMLMGAGFFVLWGKVSSADPPDRKESSKAAQHSADPESIRPTYPLETFIVNLADPGGKRYLRVKMDLELSSEKLKEEMGKRLPQIRNAILMIIPNKKFEDLATAEGKMILRDEIVVKLNTILKTGTITQLYFTEFVIQ